jgi:hypothetical protein
MNPILNLEINTKKKINWLIDFIYQTVRIKYVYIFSNNTKIKYYNRINKWHTHTIDNTDVKCDGYFDCELDDFETIKEKIYYKFDYHPEYFSHNNDDNYKINKKIFHSLMTNNIDAIYLKSTKPINIINRMGFNEDHRGSNHTKIILDFFHVAKLIPAKNIITFKNFAVACFNIKSHKFDFWYELYFGVKHVITNDKYIDIEVDFDHGS